MSVCVIGCHVLTGMSTTDLSEDMILYQILYIYVRTYNIVYVLIIYNAMMCGIDSCKDMFIYFDLLYYWFCMSQQWYMEQLSIVMI